MVLAGFALSACSEDPETPETDAVAAEHSDTELGSRLGDASDLTIAGESVRPVLLRRFYARHDFQPVWASRQDQADALLAAVSRAGDQGLDPDLFHASLLRRKTGLDPLDRELLLSDAFLSYADALARGAVPVERRRDDQVLTPEPIDVAAVLDDAMGGSDPGAAIEALAPTTPTYQALREALHKTRSGVGVQGGDRRKIEVNLERERWLPRAMPADRVWVNVADERLVFYRGDQPAFTTRVVVGEDLQRNQSPEFSTAIDASFYNPPWVIPADIAAREILPKASHDPNYLTRNKMVMLANGEVEQLAGPEAGLGYIMFDMPNKFDVYLHDTPDRYIFSRENRRISHGCIRVQNPREFASLLMQEPLDAINQGIAAGNTTRNNLPTPVPVFVVYETAFVDTDGTLQFRPDFYSRDAAIWRLLQKRSLARNSIAEVDPTLPLGPG